jgi:xanthine phosphoribosyltransferase
MPCCVAVARHVQDQVIIRGDQLLKDIQSLIRRIDKKRQSQHTGWRMVVGVARGGVFPAQRVAEALGLQYREMRVSYYQGTVKKTAPDVLKALKDDRAGDGIIVVDDVADSGETALCVRNMLPKCDLAAVYAKPAGLRALISQSGGAALYGRKMPDKWIVFPWDQQDWNDEYPRLVAAFRKTRSGATKSSSR